MMKKIVWGLCLMGAASPSFAAFFQQTKAASKPVEESPVKVEVQGADGALADNLRAFMPSLRNLTCDSPPERVERFIEASGDKLKAGAEARGYYDAHFALTSAHKGNCWVLNLAVQPGEPVKVTKVEVQVTGDGQGLPRFQEIVAAPLYQSGDVFVHQPYEDLKTKLNRAASSLGFLDAKYTTHEIEVDPDTRQAAVKVQFDTGKRYRIGEVTVAQDVLDDKYLKRYVKVHPGDAYSADDLQAQRGILESSGYYNDVQVHSHYKQAKDGQIPVDIEAPRGKRYTYTGRLGYGSDTGFRAEPEMDIHWVNRKGHSVSVVGKVAQTEDSVTAAYKVPLWKPEHEYASLSAGWKKTNTNGIRSNGFNVGFDYNRRNSHDWQQTAFVNYLDEKTQTGTDPALRSQMTLLGARVKKTQTDDPLFPTHGWQASAEVQGARKGLLSDQSLVQAKLQTKYLQPTVGKDKLILQGTAGSTWSGGQLADIPKTLRFFAGGQTSVRGYDLESIGETDANGVVIGGKNLLVGSVEYEHPFADKWSAAAFVDTGKAFNQWNKVGNKVGEGVGLRWKSPLGPVRADLAVPKGDLRSPHFYLSLGPDL